MQEPAGTWNDSRVSRTVDSIAWLEPALWVDYSLAGASYWIRLDSRRVRLPTLPVENVADTIQLHAGSYSPVHAVSRKAATGALACSTGGNRRRDRGASRTPRRPRGQVADSGRRRSDLAIESYTTWPIATVAGSFGAWLTRAQAWLDSWTGAVRQRLTRTEAPRIRAAIPTGEGGLAGVGSGGPVPIIIRGQRWARPVEVAASFAAASAGIDVPLAHTIFRPSVVEFHSGEHRLCVLDACSAAEVALGTAMTVSLQQHGLADAEREQMLKLASGIAEAFPLYQQLVMAGAVDRVDTTRPEPAGQSAQPCGPRGRNSRTRRSPSGHSRPLGGLFTRRRRSRLRTRCYAWRELKLAAAEGSHQARMTGCAGA